MKFSQLFRGRDDAYGVYLIEKADKKKVQGRAFTKTEPVTAQLYEDHLSGKTGLGIIPIMTDGTCVWGAIDVDEYKAPLETLSIQLEIMELPLVLCRSKSGGAHLYLFLSEPVSAVILRDKLFEYAAAIGYPNSELFPKQTEVSEEDVGNWINLPYYEAERTTRYALREGTPLDLKEFLEYAEEKAVSEEDLKIIKPKLIDDLEDAPPCLQYLATIGIVTGQKDSSLFNFAVYCKLKHKDNWEPELELINQAYVKPPARAETVLKVVKPHRKKSYFYTCDQPPLRDFCNRELCLARTFGIGQSEDEPKIKLGILRKVETSPPVWYMEVEGTELEFQTSDLLDQTKFRRVCFERIHVIPPMMKPATWDRILQSRLDKVERIEAPEDAGPAGQFKFHLQNFCTIGVDDEKDGLLRGRPWTDEEHERTHFVSADLIRYLNSKKFYDFSPNAIYANIRKLGGENKVLRIKGKTIRVWSTPVFEKQTEEFDLPKMDEEPF